MRLPTSRAVVVAAPLILLFTDFKRHTSATHSHTWRLRLLRKCAFFSAREPTYRTMANFSKPISMELFIRVTMDCWRNLLAFFPLPQPTLSPKYSRLLFLIQWVRTVQTLLHFPIRLTYNKHAFTHLRRGYMGTGTIQSQNGHTATIVYTHCVWLSSISIETICVMMSREFSSWLIEIN